MSNFKKVVKGQLAERGPLQLAIDLGVSVNTIRAWERQGLGLLAEARLRALVKLAKMAGVKVEAIL